MAYVVHTHSGILLSHNEMLPFTTTWTELEIIILSEVSHMRKSNITCYHLYVNIKQRYKWSYLQNRNRFTNIENKRMVSRGERGIRLEFGIKKSPHTPGFPVHTNSRSLLRLMSIKQGMPSNHLILCRPLLLLPSIFPSIRGFSSESVLHTSGGQSIGASASASVLSVKIQDWFPLGLIYKQRLKY